MKSTSAALTVNHPESGRVVQSRGADPKVGPAANAWPESQLDPNVDAHIDTNARLRRALRDQQMVLDNAGVGIVFIRERTVQRCNNRFAEIFNFSSAARAVGHSSQSLYPSESSFHALGKAAYAVMALGQTFKSEVLMRRRNGELFWTHLTGKLVNPEAVDEGSIWIVDDISAQKTDQMRLQNLLTQQNLILDNAMVGIVFLRDRQVTQCNRSFEKLFGYEPGELIGSPTRRWYINDEDWAEAGRRFAASFSVGQSFESELLLRKKDGTPICCEVHAKLVDVAHPEQGSIWIAQDISARKATEAALVQVRTELEQLVEARTLELRSTVKALEVKAAEQLLAENRIRQLAHFDALTGLPNRLLLADRCANALHMAQRAQGSVALMFLDLDHFKTINDSLGHRIGDAVLVQLASRLRAVVREQDTVSRLGGDEFIILMPDTNAAGAAHVAAKLLQLAQSPMLIQGHELTITPSIGIAIYPKDGQDLDTLSKCADAAMYRAKADGRNGFHFYAGEIQGNSDRRLALGNALRRALLHNQISLRYQPQISLESGDIVGVEALLRWHHPQLGQVSPAEFIPIAESNGLILPIGQWVIRSAIEQLAAWMQRGMAPMIMAVNLSAIQFRHADLPQFVTQCLNDARLPAELFELELTESAAMANPQAAIATLAELARRGIRLSIDDFGTGHSSLSYLKRFAVYKLKIDQAFVHDITDNPDDKAIVGAIISMAHSLGIQTIAEGVETEAQLDYLRQEGCNEVQGYLFSKPMTADAFESYILEAASNGFVTSQFSTGRIAPKRESVGTVMAPLS
jgi:diguanylate cyclase (GGDEF)-like protein/PAS domain S-box-containing protein